MRKWKKAELLGQVVGDGGSWDADVFCGECGGWGICGDGAWGAGVGVVCGGGWGESLFCESGCLRVGTGEGVFEAGEHVLGGDRLWVCAGAGGCFFSGGCFGVWGDDAAGIDPGNWRVGRVTGESIRMVNEFQATYFRKAGSVVRGVVERSIRVVGNPLGGGIPKGVSYAGYEVGSRFELLESPVDELYFGMWFLIQLVVPAGAYCLCADEWAGGDYGLF